MPLSSLFLDLPRVLRFGRPLLCFSFFSSTTFAPTRPDVRLTAALREDVLTILSLGSVSLQIRLVGGGASVAVGDGVDGR